MLSYASYNADYYHEFQSKIGKISKFYTICALLLQRRQQVEHGYLVTKLDFVLGDRS